MLRAALAGGGNDNISIVLLQDDTDPAPEEKGNEAAEGPASEEVNPQ